MNPLQLAGITKLAQIPANGIYRDIQGGTQLVSENLALPI
jgi:hypothetical protein